MKSFNEDYKFGIQQEDKLKLLFDDTFGKMKRTKNIYAKFDYYNDEYYIELKSRNVKYSTYPTTLIPYNKTQTNTTRDIIFVFNFIDGVYYIKYDKKLFNSFELKKFVRYKRNDFNDIEKLYYFIPIRELTKLN